MEIVHENEEAGPLQPLTEEETVFLSTLQSALASPSFRKRLQHARVEGGLYIRELRQEVASSQRDLASRLEISAAFLCHIESGRITLPSDLIEPLSVATRRREKKEFAAKILYAYHYPIFTALTKRDVQSIDNVTNVELASFNILPSSNELNAAKERKRDPEKGGHGSALSGQFSVMGTRLRLRRIELGLSQKTLSQGIGYSKRTAVANIEYGVARITYPYFGRWCELLKVPPQAMASFLLYYTERKLFQLLKEDEAVIYDDIEMDKIRDIAKKANPFKNKRSYIGPPYEVGNEARVDVVFELLGERIEICIHKTLRNDKKYWATNMKGKLLVDKVDFLDEVVQAI